METAAPAAGPGTAEAVDEVDGVLVMRLGLARFAVPVESVAAVVPLSPTTRLPGGPIWLAGVVNWRGHILPALDIRPLLGVERTPWPTSSRLVVLTEDGLEAGVLVEGVLGLRPRPTRFEPMPPTVTPVADSVLSGLMHDPDPISVLDIQALMGLRHQLDRTGV
jgi:chemotaxis signal transduction protein